MGGSRAEPRGRADSDAGRHASFSPDVLAGRLSEWPVPQRYVALVSGGCDSMVLLHALAAVRMRLRSPLAVLHFDHGLSPDSAAWADFVAARCEALKVPCFRESLGLEAGAAAETRAREARYERLAGWMLPGDGCLSAHHADDQAETFLLQALRGSGMAGLASMPAWTVFGRGWLGRPLLAWTRAELQAWAVRQGVPWVEDPANQDPSVPRNWLRTRVWPALAETWPAASRTLGRAAGLAADADAVLGEVAAEDLCRLGGAEAGSLPAEALLALSPPRRRNALRHWLLEQGLAGPSARKLRELEAELVLADHGARAVVSWPGARIQRYRGRLFAYRPWPPAPPDAMPLVPEQTLDLGRLGHITLRRDAGGPLGEPLIRRELMIRFRAGGERLKPAGDRHHRKLKHLLQEQSVLPWMRDRLPLLYAGDELAAVPGVVEASETFAGTGWRLDWSGAPPLH